jgi:hypothetical protein
MAREYTYFLAHAAADTSAAEQLYDLLLDVPCFLDVRDLSPGTPWDIELPKAQSISRATVALCSRATPSAYYLREEIAAAIEHERSDPDRHRLIPVYLDGTPSGPDYVPYGLRLKHALDARAMSMAGVAQQLLKLAPSLGAHETAAPPARGNLRHALFDGLLRLLDSQLEEVIFRIGAPKAHLATNTRAMRVIDTLQWADQGGPGGLDALREAIQKAAPNLQW